jgi:hypothetical protein
MFGITDERVESLFEEHKGECLEKWGISPQTYWKIQRRNRKDSVNHSVLCSLHNGGQIRYSMHRYSMQSHVDAEEVVAPPGYLTLKFQRFKGPSVRAVFNWDLPWDSISGLETGVDVIIALYVANAHNFNMHSTHEGCRS